MNKSKFFSRVLVVIMATLLIPMGHVLISASNGNALARAFLADPMSFLSARSPGARGAREFPTTKPAYSVSGPLAQGTDQGDTELFLPDIQGFLEPQASPNAELPFDTPQPFLGLSDPVQSAFPGQQIEGQLALFGDVMPPIFTAPFPTPPFEPLAVPEPDTWFMMIIGFLLTGSVLRVRNSRHLASPAKAATGAGKEGD